jgi:hypothetical protein
MMNSAGTASQYWAKTGGIGPYFSVQCARMRKAGHQKTNAVEAAVRPFLRRAKAAMLPASIQ